MIAAFIDSHLWSLFGTLAAVFVMMVTGGCSSVEATHTFHFDDGQQRVVKTVEEHTSVLNATLITAIDDPQTHHVDTYVQGGESVGKAATDVLSTAGQLGAGALIGYGLHVP